MNKQSQAFDTEAEALEHAEIIKRNACPYRGISHVRVARAVTLQGEKWRVLYAVGSLD